MRGYVAAVAGYVAAVAAGSCGCVGRTRGFGSGIRMCKTRTTECDLCAVEMHCEAESLAFVVTISALRVIQMVYARAGEEVKITDCLTAAVGRESVCGGDLGEPVI